MDEQRKRRARINRMKSGIILTITSWMIISFVAIVILIVQCVRLNNRVRYLEVQTAALTGIVAKLVPEQTREDNLVPDDEQENWLTGIDSSDNMASEGDVHYVYLTFDSEPGANTEAILDVLKQYDVKATFFVSGDESAEAEAVYQRIVDEGHTLGMHSFSNQYSTIYASAEAFRADYIRLSDYLYSVTGVESKYYRFPGSSGNEVSDVGMEEFIRILNEDGIVYYDWNVSGGDAGSDYQSEDVVANVTEGVANYKTSVVLLHDGEGKSETVDALGTLIETLQAQDAELLPIDENTQVIQYLRADSVE